MPPGRQDGDAHNVVVPGLVYIIGMNEKFLAAAIAGFYKTAPVQKGAKLAFQAFEAVRAGPEAGRRLDEFALPGQFPQAGQEIFFAFARRMGQPDYCVQIKRMGNRTYNLREFFTIRQAGFRFFAGFLVFHNGLFMV